MLHGEGIPAETHAAGTTLTVEAGPAVFGNGPLAGRETGPAGMGIRDARSLAEARAPGQLGIGAGLGHDEHRSAGSTVMPQVKGTFEVRRHAEPPCDFGDGVQAGHFRIDKRFHGPLDATGVVHMLAVGTPVEGSAAYVALERIEGTLEGRAGGFLMQHSGTLDRGAPSLSLTVVPDSASGGLEGLSGRMAIDIVDGAHHYTLDYSLDAID